MILNISRTITIYYNIIKVYGDDIVESTENEYDNAALDVLAVFCADTLAEAGIFVPEIPDVLLESIPDAVDPDV